MAGFSPWDTLDMLTELCFIWFGSDMDAAELSTLLLLFSTKRALQNFPQNHLATVWRFPFCLQMGLHMLQDGAISKSHTAIGLSFLPWLYTNCDRIRSTASRRPSIKLHKNYLKCSKPTAKREIKSALGCRSSRCSHFGGQAVVMKWHELAGWGWGWKSGTQLSRLRRTPTLLQVELTASAWANSSTAVLCCTSTALQLSSRWSPCPCLQSYFYAC